MSTAGSVRTAKSSRVPPLQRSPLMMFVGPRSRLGLRLTARPFLILRAPMPAVVFFFFSPSIVIIIFIIPFINFFISRAG